MPPRPAQKRSAPSRGEPSAVKKTRIVEPSEDPASFAEHVDEALEGPSARGRRVRTEGYDSDSSDEGGGRRRDGPTGGASAGADEDADDMFAIGEKSEETGAADGKKKEEYLRLGDIDGQVFDDREEGQGEDEDESGDEDEPEDEDDAIRRSKTGMGYELSSFNMREEMEEGKFTEDGMYVRNRDEHAIHDRWMDGVDEREIKQARRRRKQRERAERERQQAEERELQDAGGKEQLERDLLVMLKKGETVLEALQRLGAQVKKSQKLEKKKPKPKSADNATMEVDKSPKTEKVTIKDQATAKSFSPIEHVTHIASMLMSLGDADIYSRTYEELVRSVRRSGKVPEDWDPPSADVRYEYKWDVPESTAEGQVFGPYSEEEMKAWNQAAYFGVGAEKIRVRTVGGEWGSWDDVVI